MISVSDHSRIRRAIAAANTSTHRFKVGACVSVAGRLSCAPNVQKNDARIAWQFASVHAEVNALSGAYRDGYGGTIYVARLGSTGRLLPSFPCHRCIPHLVEAGVRRIVWFNGKNWVASRVSELTDIAVAV